MKIAVIGSTSGLGFSTYAEEQAIAIGREVARQKHILLYGPEPSVASLPFLAAKSAREAGGLVIAIAIGRAKTPFYEMEVPTTVIYCESAGGAGRETIFINSADAVISIGGGSGTLTEIGIAYMNTIPVVAIAGTGGWSDKLAGTYLDERKKFIIPLASTAQDAIQKAEELYSSLKNIDPTSFL